jgi:hypothetical protein
MARNEFTPDQEKWLALLESGKIPQTCGTLKDNTGYCCLGVATEFVCGIFPELHDSGAWIYDGDYETYAPPSVVSLMHFHGSGGCNSSSDQVNDVDTGSLADMNDRGLSFKEIAAEVRKTPWKWFSNFDYQEG